MFENHNYSNKLSIPRITVNSKPVQNSFLLRSDAEKLPTIKQNDYRSLLDSQVRIKKLQNDLNKTGNDIFIQNELNKTRDHNKVDFSMEDSFNNIIDSFGNKAQYTGYNENNASRQNTNYINNTPNRTNRSFRHTGNISKYQDKTGFSYKREDFDVPMYDPNDNEFNMHANKYTNNANHLKFNLALSSKIDPEEERLKDQQKSLSYQTALEQQIESQKDRADKKRRENLEQELREAERVQNELPSYLQSDKSRNRKFNQRSNIQQKDHIKTSKNLISNDFKDQQLLSKVEEEQRQYQNYTKFQLPLEIRESVSRIFEVEKYNLDSVMKDRDDLLKKQQTNFHDYVDLIEKGKVKAEVDLMKQRDELGKLRYFENLRDRRLYQSIEKTDEYLKDFKNANWRPSEEAIVHGGSFGQPYEDCMCSKVANPWGDLDSEIKHSKNVFDNSTNQLSSDNYWVDLANRRLKRNISTNGSRILGDRKNQENYWNSSSYLGDSSDYRSNLNQSQRLEEIQETKKARVNQIFGELDHQIGDLKNIQKNIAV